MIAHNFSKLTNGQSIESKFKSRFCHRVFIDKMFIYAWFAINVGDYYIQLPCARVDSRSIIQPFYSRLFCDHKINFYARAYVAFIYYVHSLIAFHWRLIVRSTGKTTSNYFWRIVSKRSFQCCSFAFGFQFSSKSQNVLTPSFLIPLAFCAM